MLACAPQLMHSGARHQSLAFSSFTLPFAFLSIIPLPFPFSWLCFLIAAVGLGAQRGGRRSRHLNHRHVGGLHTPGTPVPLPLAHANGRRRRYDRGGHPAGLAVRQHEQRSMSLADRSPSAPLSPKLLQQPPSAVARCSCFRSPRRAARLCNSGSAQQPAGSAHCSRRHERVAVCGAGLQLQQRCRPGKL